MCTTFTDRFLSSSGTGTDFFSPSLAMIVAHNVTSTSFALAGFRRTTRGTGAEQGCLGLDLLRHASHLPQRFMGTSPWVAAGAGAGASPSPSPSLLPEGSTARFLLFVPLCGLAGPGRLLPLWGPAALGGLPVPRRSSFSA